MRTTFDHLCTLVRAKREQIVSRLSDRDDSISISRYYHVSTQKEIIGEVLYDFILDCGPIQIRGFTIGIALSTGGFSNLRSSNGAKLKTLVEDLLNNAMQGFANDVINKWKSLKEQSGVIKENGRDSEAQKFVGQKFRGFD